jgi:small subunit ribosomal protein S18
MVEDSQTEVKSRNPLDLTWTDVEGLLNFVTDNGRILPRRMTGLSASHQRHVTRMIKRARNMLLMK